GSSTLTIGNTGSVSAGTYAINVEGTDGSEIRSAAFNITVADTVPAAPDLSAPAHGSNGIAVTPTFVWEGVAGAVSYRLEVAEDAGFGTLVIDESVTTTSFTPAGTLNPDSPYFWRVTAMNACGNGIASTVFTF